MIKTTLFLAFWLTILLALWGPDACRKLRR